MAVVLLPDNWYQKLVPFFWYQFSGTGFLYRISGRLSWALAQIVETIAYIVLSDFVQTVQVISVKDAAKCSLTSTTGTNISNTHDALIKEIASSPAICAPGLRLQSLLVYLLKRWKHLKEK